MSELEFTIRRRDHDGLICPVCYEAPLRLDLTLFADDVVVCSNESCEAVVPRWMTKREYMSRMVVSALNEDTIDDSPVVEAVEND